MIKRLILLRDEAIDADFSSKIAWRGRTPVPISRKVRAHILNATKRVPSFNQLCFELKQRKAYQRSRHLKSNKDGFCRATLTNFRLHRDGVLAGVGLRSTREAKNPMENFASVES